MIDPLVVIGVFGLGAAAGSLLTYVRYRGEMNHYREVSRRGSPYVPPEARPDRLCGCDISKWTFRKAADAGTANFVAGGTDQVDDTLPGRDSDFALLSTSTLSSEVHEAREAAK